MTEKRTLSDGDALALIKYIRRRAGGHAGEHDYFQDVATVSELVESTLVGLGFDRDWVFGPFSDMLAQEVRENQEAIRRQARP